MTKIPPKYDLKDYGELSFTLKPCFKCESMKVDIYTKYICTNTKTEALYSFIECRNCGLTSKFDTRSHSINELITEWNRLPRDFDEY